MEEQAAGDSQPPEVKSEKSTPSPGDPGPGAEHQGDPVMGLRDRSCKKIPVSGSSCCPNGEERKTTAPQMINEARLRGINIHLDATSDVI